ncbi:hypothetical protein PR048_007163, partial [Dryococelus australis]
MVNIPSPQKSYVRCDGPKPFAFVADEGFGLSKYILRPYAMQRIFHRPLNVDLTLAEYAVNVCCVRDKDGIRIEDNLTVEGLLDMEPAARPTSILASNVRDTFANYFVSSEGAVPWRME